MPGKNLTRDEAAGRARILTVESYDVTLDLTTGTDHFHTVTTVRFDCSEPGAATFVDLIAPSVQKVTLNGVDLDPADVFADSRIALPDLAEHNELVVDATGAYTNTGEGLHRFVDPVDNEVYLYTQFEVADSRRMYAVFEQPDLKATFTFEVTAPAHWKVISNSPTPAAAPAGVAGGVERATWSFSPTPRISSYITALIAGPYDEVRDSVETRVASCPSVFSAAGRSRSTSTPRTSSTAPSGGSPSSRRSSTTRTPSRSTTRSSRRSTTWARWRTRAR